MMAPVAKSAEQIRKERKPVGADNPFVAIQENISRNVVTTLDAWREMTEALAERTFLAIYGLPALQAAAGIDQAAARPLRKASKNPLHHELLQKRIGELKSNITVGGLREAVVRALLYAGMARAAVDERGFEVVRRIRKEYAEVSLSAFKALVREQFYMLLVDTEGALAAIPAMLPPDSELRHKAFNLIKQVLSARGEFSADDRQRILRIAKLFGVDEKGSTVQTLSVVPPARKQAKAS
jgi:hypothetical protein